MRDLPTRLGLRLLTYRLPWQSDRGAIAIREMIAIAAVGIIILVAVVAVLDVAGFDVAGWFRDQLGITSSE